LLCFVGGGGVHPYPEDSGEEAGLALRQGESVAEGSEGKEGTDEREQERVMQLESLCIFPVRGVCINGLRVLVNEKEEAEEERGYCGWGGDCEPDEWLGCILGVCQDECQREGGCGYEWNPEVEPCFCCWCEC